MWLASRVWPDGSILFFFVNRHSLVLRLDFCPVPLSALSHTGVSMDRTFLWASLKNCFMVAINLFRRLSEQ